MVTCVFLNLLFFLFWELILNNILFLIFLIFFCRLYVDELYEWIWTNLYVDELTLLSYRHIQGRTPVAYRKMGISSLKSLTLFRVIPVYEMAILHALAIALPNEQTLSLDH